MNRCIAPFSVVLWLVSMGCDDHLFPNPHEDTTVSGEG